MRIIQIVFFCTFLVCLVTGIVSFTHEHDLFDSLALLAGAAANFLSWVMLRRQRKAAEGNDIQFITDRRIGIFYIITAGIFVILTILSFYYTPEILTPATLLICAVTQLLGYRVFIRQQRNTARNPY